MFRRQLSSLRSTYKLMISFGLFMGIVFPFYSFLFFGSPAFSPLYAAGCLLAGFLVGTACYWTVKQVLRINLERQWETLGVLADSPGDPAEPRDELLTLMRRHDALLERVLALVQYASAQAAAIQPKCGRLAAASRTLAAGNAQQVEEVRRNLRAIREMKEAFGDILRDVEDISARSEQRAEIALDIGAATDHIAESMKGHAENVMDAAASITAIAESIRTTRDVAEGLADSAAQTAVSISQVTEAIADVRDFAQRTSGSSAKVRIQAEEGSRAMGETLLTMKEIEASSEASFLAIGRLSVHSSKVDDLLTVIRKVLERTNLLALNAAIIAAQTGEKGKAFGVVAGEVRKLAQQTEHATRGIANLLRGIGVETAAVQHAVTLGRVLAAKGVKITETARGALERIHDSALEASEMVGRIAAATVDQASAGQVIREEAEKNLDRVRQVTAAVQRQEQESSRVVSAVEDLRELSKSIATAAEDLALANQEYRGTILADANRAAKLGNTSRSQWEASDPIVASVQDTGALIEANASRAHENLLEVDAIAALASVLADELSKFTRGRAVQPGRANP